MLEELKFIYAIHAIFANIYIHRKKYVNLPGVAVRERMYIVTLEASIMIYKGLVDVKPIITYTCCCLEPSCSSERYDVLMPMYLTYSLLW